MYACLRGKRVVLSGDSMMRQLFGQWVALLRGYSRPIIADFHANMLMQMSLHEDFIEIDPDLTSYPAPGKSELQIIFLWKPTELLNMRELESFEPHVYVAGIMYWDDTTQGKMRDHVLKVIAPSNVSRFLYVGTPLQPHYQSLLNHTFAVRNQQNKDFFESYGASRMQFVDFERIRSDMKAAPVEGPHFQCGVSAKPGSNDFELTRKHTEGSDSRCLDLPNRRVLEEILKTQCKA